MTGRQVIRSTIRESPKEPKLQASGVGWSVRARDMELRLSYLFSGKRDVDGRAVRARRHWGSFSSENATRCRAFRVRRRAKSMEFTSMVHGRQREKLPRRAGRLIMEQLRLKEGVVHDKWPPSFILCCAVFSFSFASRRQVIPSSKERSSVHSLPLVYQ